MCVCTVDLSHFSAAVFLQFAAGPLVADILSKIVGIACAVNNTLTFPTPKDSASLLYG